MANQPNWFVNTEGLCRGIAFCNERLSDECFSSVLEYLFRTIDNPTKDATGSPTDSDAETEMENLRITAQLNEQEFKLALQSMAYLVKRSLKYMLKPSSLQVDLRNYLQLSENKCNSFVKYWIQSTKIVLDALEADDDNEHGKSNQLEDVSWKVRAQLSSEPRQKDKLALGQLELKTGRRTVNLELNSGEIVEFYNQLERIQVELDSLNAKA
ncbi:COMM domain-containing protein 10-like [Ochlerotatus camptorhynchus]|uniref:COMM domain-containing protein 10-like n=1 Tax=Ochlerotatus camptorhynchus TaxID=644619 RepID=UPI0031D198F7